MKNTTDRPRKTYQAPCVTVVEVAVEKVFAATGGSDPWTPGGGF